MGVVIETGSYPMLHHYSSDTTSHLSCYIATGRSDGVQLTQIGRTPVEYLCDMSPYTFSMCMSQSMARLSDSILDPWSLELQFFIVCRSGDKGCRAVENNGPS